MRLSFSVIAAVLIAFAGYSAFGHAAGGDAWTPKTIATVVAHGHHTVRDAAPAR